MGIDERRKMSEIDCCLTAKKVKGKKVSVIQKMLKSLSVIMRNEKFFMQRNPHKRLNKRYIHLIWNENYPELLCVCVFYTTCNWSSLIPWLDFHTLLVLDLFLFPFFLILLHSSSNEHFRVFNELSSLESVTFKFISVFVEWNCSSSFKSMVLLCNFN